jgi:hypothetical protein
MARIAVFLAFVDVAFQFAHAQVGFRHQGDTRATLGGVEGWGAFEWLELDVIAAVSVFARIFAILSLLTRRLGQGMSQ